MRRILSLFITLTLVVTLFAVANKGVSAEATTTCATDSTVFVHYHRWDETYTDTTIWTWGYGTGGSGDGSGVVEEDGFGATYQICVNSTDAGDELGLILKYGAGWGDGMTDRDGVDTDENGTLDGNHKNIAIRDAEGNLLGFDENGVKHVYVFEGSNQINYTTDTNSLPFSDDLATIAIVYYDGAESYDGWNIWTWDTGTLGTQLNENFYGGSGVPLVSGLGVDGGTVENFRVAFINLDPADMGAEIGFIMRTDAWEKKNLDGENIMISTDGLVAGDFQSVFYIAGEGVMHTTFEDFEATVNFFELESARALDPTSVEVLFNKDVVTQVDDVITFDETAFTLEDKDGAAVVIDSVSFNSTADVNKAFTLILSADLMGSQSPYTVSYTVGEGDDMMVYTNDFSVDSLAPVITIIGSQNVTLELGDTYSLPTYSGSDKETAEDTESTVIYNVKVKDGHGTVDTRFAGIYEVVIVAEDKFGNETEEMITVTVMDPCDDTAHLDANNFNTELIALLVGIPLAFGAVIALRRSY